MAADRRASANMLHRRLPTAEAALLAPHLEAFTLHHDEVLCASGERITHAIFPVSGIIALVGSTSDGATIHCGLTGLDGMFGLPLSAGVLDSTVEARVQGRGESLRIESVRFRALLRQCPVLGRRIQLHALLMLDQTTLISTCNGHHSVEARTARWVLSISDRMGSDVITLTQSTLAAMIGVLRPSINQAAGSLREKGLLDYRRGEITIIDRIALTGIACDCYRTLNASYVASLP